jgi:hypothetical protein
LMPMSIRCGRFKSLYKVDKSNPDLKINPC